MRKPPTLADVAARVTGLTKAVENLRGFVKSERRSDEERLRELKLRALAELAAGAGHEINNPLAVISGQAQYLLRTEESIERVRALERIIAQSHRIHRLLTDLMIYARPPEPKWEVVDLERLIHKVAEGLNGLAIERRVRLDVRPIAHRVRIRADAGLLEMAISCLLRNAIEAAPAEGWARIQWAVGGRQGSGIRSQGSVKTGNGAYSNTDDSVQIVIEDNGPGLGVKQQEHLFDPFYSGRSAGRSLGLGLPKVWRIAQLHGGNVQFTSEPGQPTRFVLSLPLPQKAHHLRKQKAGKRASLNGKHRMNGHTSAVLFAGLEEVGYGHEYPFYSLDVTRPFLQPLESSR